MMDVLRGLPRDAVNFGSANRDINVSFEQHASVSRAEEFGINKQGYLIVNVAQKLDLTYSSATGRLGISAFTDVFPSASLSVNNSKIMQYDQPSFAATHRAKLVGIHPIRFQVCRLFLNMIFITSQQHGIQENKES